MGFQGPPAADFYSQLSGLGDVIQANRTAQAKRDAFAQATMPGADGKIDYGRAVLGLAQVDPQAAALLAQRQNHEDTLKQQAIDNARNTSRDATTDKHWSADYTLRRMARDDARDPTPDNYEKLPGGGYRPLQGGPADPAYLESVAAAKARAAAAVPPEGFAPGPDGGLQPRAGGPTDPAYLARVAAEKARAAASIPPEGFSQGADGGLAPRTGGPTDPAYIARVDAEKARARGDVPTIIGPGSSVIVPNKASEGPVFTNKPAGGGLSQDALDIRAAQWNNGDYEGATKNVGRGAQGGATLEAIANRAAERLIEAGHSPEDAAALTSANMQKFRASGIFQNTESRTGASREANLNIILKAADAAIPAALEASDKVSRTGFVPLNKVIQAGKVMTSDPDLRAFGMANLQLAEHWARAMNPTGVMRESDRDMALHFLSLADTKETYKSSVMQLKAQITRERDAIRSATPAHGPQSTASPPAGSYVWTPDSGLVSK